MHILPWNRWVNSSKVVETRRRLRGWRQFGRDSTRFDKIARVWGWRHGGTAQRTADPRARAGRQHDFAGLQRDSERASDFMQDSSWPSLFCDLCCHPRLVPKQPSFDHGSALGEGRLCGCDFRRGELRTIGNIPSCGFTAILSA